MGSATVLPDDVKLSDDLRTLSVQDQGQMQGQCGGEDGDGGYNNHGGLCSICLCKIPLRETALVKGCEHAYCVTCILRWTTYTRSPTCPKCKCPFEFLNIHRSLDGSIHDYMFEESVCLLQRAKWFEPLVITDHHDEQHNRMEDWYCYDADDGDFDGDYFYGSSSSSLRIGNRRWGDNGYVRAGRQEARPAPRRSEFNDSGDGSSSSSKYYQKEGAVKSSMGRRAKRTLKREAAGKAQQSEQDKGGE